MAADILGPEPGQALVPADLEHFNTKPMDRVKTGTNFDLLVPMQDRPQLRAKLRALPPEAFQPRWAGYATTKRPYTPRRARPGRSTNTSSGKETDRRITG